VSGGPISDGKPMGQRVDVDVVICAYTLDRWDDLLAAIDSVALQSLPAAQTIVVVDHAHELFARLGERSDIVLVSNEGEPGLASARNAGIAETSATIVAFLDDDARADPDWLEYLVRSYANPFVLGVGGSASPVWDTGRPAWFPEEFDWVVGCTYRGMPTVSAEVRNMIGSNMSFRRDVLIANDGFRVGSGRVAGSRLPMGNEETELCLRATASSPGSDSMIVFAPAAIVDHRVRTERSTSGYFVRRCWAEGLSKAWTVRSTDSSRPLTTERAYVRRTLPAAVGRSVADIALRRRPGGVGRIGAITVGLAATGGGYVRGRLTRGSR
jgi:glycosyltransferase involved in cell wall biosynthesis